MKAASKVAKFSGAAAPKKDTPITAAAPARRRSYFLKNKSIVVSPHVSSPILRARTHMHTSGESAVHERPVDVLPPSALRG